MKAIEVSAFGGVETISVVERDEPVAGPGQVVVDVEATGVNYADVMMRRGLYVGGPTWDCGDVSVYDRDGDDVSGTHAPAFSSNDTVTSSFAPFSVARKVPTPSKFSIVKPIGSVSL